MSDQKNLAAKQESGNSEIAELREIVNKQAQQIESMQQQLSGRVSVAQPVYVDAVEERRRLQLEKSYRKSRRAMQSRAVEERKLVEGEVKYFLCSDKEPMMGRCVGVRALGSSVEEIAICKSKYMTYFGMTDTVKQIHAEPFTEAHWEKIPAHVRESIHLEAAAA